MRHFFPKKLSLSLPSFNLPYFFFRMASSAANVNREVSKVRAPPHAIILHRRRLVRRLRRSIFEHPRPAVRVRAVSRSRKRSWRKQFREKNFFFSPLFSSRLRSAILRVLPIRKCANRLRFAASEREVCRAISSDPERRMLIVRREQSAILEPGRFAKMARGVD